MTDESSGRRSAPAARDPSASMSLLTDVMRNTLDEGYQAAAEEKGAPTGPGRTGRVVNLLAVLALFGVLVTVAAVETDRAAPAEAEERAELIERINEQSARVERLRSTVGTLEGDVEQLQAELQSTVQAERKLESRAERLGIISGSTPLTGPGMTVTVDDSSWSGIGDQGIVRDTDLQALVNSLWVAGAEAIAINQQRITSTTAIRGAGKAITVNFRPLSRPYVVRAIGDPDELEARLLETSGGQAWLDFEANFGARFDPETSGNLSLPGQSMRQPRVAKKGNASS